MYTTNVEGERESEAEFEREDFFFRVLLALKATTDVSPGTRLNIDTGAGFEKHVNRPDLDNSNDPFARFRIASVTQYNHWTLDAEAGWERAQDAQEAETPGKRRRFIPGTRKIRQISTVYDYGAGLKWDRDPFALGGSYEFSAERFDDEVFQDGDKDEHSVNYFASWQVRRNLALRYTVEKTKTENINDPGPADGKWKTTETITFDWRLGILKRPELTYSFGLEKEDTDTEEGTWDPKHTLALNDRRELTSTLRLALSAAYSQESDPEEDDVAFTYGALLEHDISPRTRQSFSARREPVETFGATTETDSTTYGYTFQQREFLVRDLSLSFNADYAIDKPVDGPEERTLSYTFLASHRRALSRKLDRSIEYRYSWEDSNLEEEVLDEYRLTLSYIYKL